jgi:hypothetical protein
MRNKMNTWSCSGLNRKMGIWWGVSREMEREAHEREGVSGGINLIFPHIVGNVYM